MLRACVQRFDVTKNLENFCKILGTKQHLSSSLLSMVLNITFSNTTTYLPIVLPLKLITL